MFKALSETRKPDLRPATEAPESTRTRPVFAPRADIFETADALVVTAEMPGVDEKSVDVMLERNILTIRGTVAADPPAGYSLMYAEYEMGDYLRVFTLPDEVNRDGIRAGVKNGVLTLTLPKAEPARKVEVRAQ